MNSLREGSSPPLESFVWIFFSQSGGSHTSVFKRLGLLYSAELRVSWIAFCLVQSRNDSVPSNRTCRHWIRTNQLPLGYPVADLVAESGG